MAQVDNVFVPLDDDSFACMGQILTAQIFSIDGADNTLISENNRQESCKRKSSVHHLVTSVRLFFVFFKRSLNVKISLG